MLNFFRKIRKQLANENKFQKYSRYAFGEVVLIMLGIFMALQLQNWNENRKQEIQFKTTLEQLYNTINDDSWYFQNQMNQFKDVILNTDLIMNADYKDLDVTFIMGLWYMSMFNNDTYHSESNQIIKNLEYNTGNEEQVNIVKQLYGYSNLISIKSKNAFKIDNKITEVLLENNIAFPRFEYNEVSRGLIFDSTYYDQEDYQKALILLQDKNFRTHLKSQRSQRAFQVLDYKALYTDAQATIGLIKDYHPEAKLLFQKVGIIGTSIDGFDDVGGRSTPMVLVDKENSIWEIELYLKEGRVKFRCRDSWAINWGGITFPKGDAVREQGDIIVNEAGNYRVVLNLTDNGYEFIKLED